MKRFLLIALVALCLCIVACGGKLGDNQTTNEQDSNKEVENNNGSRPDESVSGDSSAETEVGIVVIDSTKNELAIGDEFTLTVSIKNNPGIFAFAFELPVDDNIFEFVSADTSSSICTMFGICDYDEISSMYKFNGLNASPLENLTSDGVIVTITLKVKDSAEAGEYLLSAKPDLENIINVDGNLVTFNGADISIVVTR